MFANEDDYTKAIKGSRIHAYEKENQSRSMMKGLFSLTALVSIAYGGFFYYENNMINVDTLDKTLANTSVMSATHTVTNTTTTMKHIVEDDYLVALENMEVDVLEDNSYVEKPQKTSSENLNASNQLSLSDAMSSIVDNAMADNSTYTKAISKEIKKENTLDSFSSEVLKEINTLKSLDNRVVVVKKGDTLAGLSEKFYGNSMKYNKIIASNRTLQNSSSKIYIGQEITLPY